jgi:hypothetical protein
MIADKEIARQILERDFLNLYNYLPQVLNNSGLNISPYLGLFENKIMAYADQGIEYILNLLFDSDQCDAEEAAEIAKLFVNDKIENYRAQIRAKKAGMNNE